MPTQRQIDEAPGGTYNQYGYDSAGNRIANPNPVGSFENPQTLGVNFNQYSGQSANPDSLNAPIPQVPEAPQDDYSAIMAGVMAANPVDTGSNDAIQNQILSLSSELGGQTGYADTQATTYDLAGKKQRVNDLTYQINQLNAESVARQENIMSQGGGITKTIASSQAQFQQRTDAIKALGLSAQLQAAQGNVSLAEEQIQRAVDLKYKPILDQIEVWQKAYEFNKDNLSRSEKKQADAINMAYDMYKQEIADKQADEKQVKTQLLDFMSKYPSAGISMEDSFESAQQKILDSPQYKQEQAKQALEMANTRSIIGERNAKATTGSDNVLGAETPAGQMNLATTEANIQSIDNLLTDSYMSSAVQPSGLIRFSPLSLITGGKGNFIAGVEQIASQLNLNALIQAKAQGATFGALSDQELRVLASSATKIGSWAVKNKEGQTTGYKTTPGAFKKELEKIQNFAKLDYILKGGDMTQVGATITPDGKVWVKNADGTMTQLK